ncbi:hypothetical protein O181_047086 [Austropuccinia psidii MF-1]|uniref:DUF7872 domain-containing protein n=1 Tax=Austropuccinia psidii MF-1 TaxID=1389203 RepID=A0A9Q3HJ75_9BASI|nr:hypothetical protein [Austropuccinia psidii MF-1]
MSFNTNNSSSNIYSDFRVSIANKLSMSLLILSLLASSAFTQVPQKFERRQIAGNADADCSGYELNRGTWAELGIDNYLRHYPHGQNMSLFEYTHSLNVFNFDCGIKKFCMAGQLCHPIRGRDWVVLSAVQEWNFYINSLYDAVGSAMAEVQETSAAMIADFLPDFQEKKALMFLTIGLLSLTGVVLLSFAAVVIIPMLWAFIVAAWTFTGWGLSTAGAGIAAGWVWMTSLGAETTVGAVEATEVAATAAGSAGAAAAGEAAADEAAAAALSTEQAALVQGEAAAAAVPAGTAAVPAGAAVAPAEAAVAPAEAAAAPAGAAAAPAAQAAGAPLVRRGLFRRDHRKIPEDKFSVWAALNTNLRQAQNHLQSIISVSARLTLYSPISSQNGLYGVLQNGTFLSDHPPKATLMDNARESIQLGALAQFFKLLNMVFVIDPAPCKQEGPTTPLKNPEAVHFCSSAGVKTSLAMIKNKEIDYKIRNGRLLFAKYSYSTDYLYQMAADCQSQRESRNLPPANGTLVLANQPSSFLQNSVMNGNTANNGTLINGVNGFSDKVHNGTQNKSNSTAPNSNSTILLPDGSTLCKFPVPICDLRKPEIKDKISSGMSPAKACREVLQLPKLD